MLEKIQITEPVTLEELRKLSGLTQKNFAETVGIPLTTYRHYERNPEKMEVGQLIKICETFGLRLEKVALK